MKVVTKRLKTPILPITGDSANNREIVQKDEIVMKLRVMFLFKADIAIYDRSVV